MSDARSDFMRLVTGFQASRAVHVAAALGLADALRDGPASAEELARATAAHPESLVRLMRVLAGVGVLRAVGNDRFGLTEMGRWLRRDVEGSCAPMTDLFARSNVWEAWGGLLHTVQTGNTAFDHVHGCNVWDYRAGHPAEALVFDRAMASGSDRLARVLLDVYDFGRFDHVVDLGGGDGSLLAVVLDRHPALRGTLFDRPDVIARSSDFRAGLACADRLQAVDGDFFDRVPADGDLYLLKWILHDWSDTAAVDILKSCRRAMRPTGRILVAELIIGPGYASPEGELMDLTMMVMNGGRERTVDEFSAIFAEAGFRLAAVTRTGTPFYLLEGRRAD